MPKKIILVRHGDVHNPEKVLYGRTVPVHLSERGKSQIASVARRIAELGITVSRIHTSTLTRALETADILAATLHATVTPNEQLVDIHIPALVGKSIDERRRIHALGGDEYSDEWVKLGHESRRDIIFRMSLAFKSVLTASDPEVSLIVSHGDPLTFLLYHLENPAVTDVPVVSELLSAGFGIRKGHGVVLTIGRNFRIVHKEYLIPVEPLLDGTQF